MSILYSSNYNETKYLKQLNIDYNKIIRLMLIWGVGNLKILEDIDFKELKELDLSFNNISDISILENVKLEILKLSNNKISNNINILENVDFKELNLYDNNISDISIFENVKLEKLKN